MKNIAKKSPFTSINYQGAAEYREWQILRPD